MTPEDLRKVKLLYPVSKDVETLSLAGACAENLSSGMIASACAGAPEPEQPSQGKPSYGTTHVRSARAKARGRANLHAGSSRSIAELERVAWNAALVKARAQAGLGKGFLVRVTSIRENLLDEDNLCEKYHVDLCRYAGVIPSDAPGQTHIEVLQRKAEPGEGEHVKIEVFRIR